MRHLENPAGVLLHAAFERSHASGVDMVAPHGDDAIDEIFEKITAVLGDTLWDKWSGFIERQDLYEEAGLENEMLDMVIRDLSWAFIEQTLEKNDFFTYLLNIYREGYFPCAWDGGYPSGKPVVL